MIFTFALLTLSACNSNNLVIERILLGGNFKNAVANLKSEGVDAIFLNLQDEKTIESVIQTLSSEAEGIQLFGNDLVLEELPEGLIGAETIYSEFHDDLLDFQDLPYLQDGARLFDAIKLLDEGISTVGDDAKTFKKWLSSLKNWEGTSGKLNFDKNANLIDLYKVKIVKDGKIEFYNEKDKPTPPVIPFSSSGLEEYEEKLKPKSEPAKGEPINIIAQISSNMGKEDYRTVMQKIAEIALSKINSEGGINGQPLELIWQECEEKTKGTQIVLGICKNQNSQNLFNIIPTESEQGKVLAKFAKEKGFKKIGILTEEQPYTLNIEESFKKTFEK